MKRKKIIKNIISFLTVICCLAGNTAAVTATEAEEDQHSRVIIVNEKELYPYLYVSKTVAGQGAPEEDEFIFRIEVKKSEDSSYEPLEAGTTYQKFNFETDPGHQHPLVNGNGNKGSTNFRLESFGVFTLKAGQEARFTLGKGWSYRVTEDAKTGYKQQVKTRTGTLDEEAQSVGFVNEYQGGGPGNDAVLRIEKEIGVFEHYQLPEGPEFMFRLEVKTGSDYEPYAGQSFEISKEEGGGSLGKTDDAGIFQIGADCAAVFDSLPPNAVYRVRELTSEYIEDMLEALKKQPDDIQTQKELKELFPKRQMEKPEERQKLQDEINAWKAQWPDWQTWWLKGDDTELVREGSTMKEKTETFTNANVSFGIGKQLSDNSRPDDAFTFELTDGDQVMANVPYYLCRTDTGKPIENTDNPLGNVGSGVPESGNRKWVHRTDEKGQFSLKVGQTAVFLGMEPGTAYIATELKTNFAYQVRTPASGSYSRDVEVEPERLMFTNEPMQEGGLIVSKRVITEGEVPAKDTFKFILRRRVAYLNGEELKGDALKEALERGDPIEYKFQPAAGRQYTVGGEKPKTGEDGSFTLRANENAIFDFVMAGDIYQVEEVLQDPDMENALDYEFKELTVHQDETDITEASVEKENPNIGASQIIADSKLILQFVSVYTPHRLDLQLVKVDGEGIVLAGAEFKLYRNANLSDPVTTTVDGAERDTYRVDDQGRLTIPNLKAGSYWLQEVRPPSGYRLLPRAIRLDLNRVGGTRIVVGIKGNTMEFADPQAGTQSPEELETLNPPGSYVEPDWKDEEITGVMVSPPTGSGTTQGNVTITLKVCNEKFYDLPKAGGMGIYWYIIGGVLLMAGASLIYIKTIYGRGGAKRYRN